MHPTKHLKVHSRGSAAKNLARLLISRLEGQLLLLGRKQFRIADGEGNEAFLAAAETRAVQCVDATLMLAVIAGFAAWIITQLLRVVLG